MSINRGMDKEDGRLPWWFPDRVYLPIQETQVTWSGKIRHALEQLSPCTTTELVLWSPGAAMTELTCHNDWAHMPQWPSSHAAVTELTCRSDRAHMPQWPSSHARNDRAHMPQWPSSHAAVTELTCRSDWGPCTKNPCFATRKATTVRSPCTTTRSPSPCN